MKASLEKIQPVFGSSFNIRRFKNMRNGGSTFWHFHPEYEIVYISCGRGKRHIGDHISYYEQGDLIFLGPNLPHFGFTEELADDNVEVVVQMKEDFLGRDFFQRPEMHGIQQLFQRAHQGISYFGETKRIVGERLDRMVDLNNFDRLLELLSVLQIMAHSEDYKLLNAKGLAFEVSAQDHERMQAVYEYVEQHFQQEINLDEAARRVNMTAPAFCRYFKKLTNKTFIQFTNEFRIAHACRLLANEDESIAGVSYDSGFNNLSHFNKQFKKIAGLSPREYRKSLRKVVE